MGKLTYLFVGILCLLTASCGKLSKQLAEEDTLVSGHIKIAIDESFKPIVEEQLQVFLALHPEASITPIYCNEVEAIHYLLQDSVRVAITTRALTTDEEHYLNKKKFFPRSVPIASDGVALITHKENPDSLLTVHQFKQVVTGEVTEWKELFPESPLGSIQLVFDNPNSSSVRYVLDSITGGAALPNHLKALKTNPEVVNYVAMHPEALGVIGVNWIGNSADSTRLSFHESVRVLALSKEWVAQPANSYKPFQAYLALGEYPFTRTLYAVVNDPKSGLPSGFLNFLTGFRGQRIILKSGLVPATAAVRIVDIKTE
ncbi:MAG: PstS family phosphate ABC transporter substrate-binding protein [Phocaeicola sp.]